MSKAKNKQIQESDLANPVAPTKRKKKKWPIIIILLLVIGGALFFFKKPILSGLRKVPIIGEFIPVQELDEEEVLTPEELKEKINLQLSEIEQLKVEIEKLENMNTTLSEKNMDLLQYESMYTDFMKQKENWDEEIAKTNPELFIQQFETVYPEVAERIYQSLKSNQVLLTEQKKLATTIAQMDESQAAAALELLISTDPELIQFIFEGLGTDRRAIILSEMTEQSAAQVIKLISPDT